MTVGVQTSRMEASYFTCGPGGISTLALNSPVRCLSFRMHHHNDLLFSPSSYCFGSLSLVFCDKLSSTPLRSRYHIRNSSDLSSSRSNGSNNDSPISRNTTGTKRRSRSRRTNDRVGGGNSGGVGGDSNINWAANKISGGSSSSDSVGAAIKQKQQQVKQTTKSKPVDVRALYQNGDPLGRRDLGKSVVRWISHAQHRAVARKVPQPRAVHGGLGMDLDKARAIQTRIDDFTKRMSDLLRIERDSELEFTQQELDAVPTPDETSDSSKPIEFLVSHGQAEQELCDTICNLRAVSTSTGLGGMHLVLFRGEGNHRLPPTTLSPGDMVCVRTCDSRGAGTTSCMQGLVNNLGEDGCSISIGLESRHGDPTFSKLFGKSVRIDRIHGLADALTYERNCEALMMLQKKGLQKRNPSIAVVATLFGDTDDVAWLEANHFADWSEAEIDGLSNFETYDESQRRAISLGLNQRRPLLIVQGPPGTGKTGLLKELIKFSVKQGERVLVTAPTNAAVDNMVDKLSDIGISIVRVGNPARISSAVASKSLVEIANAKLASFRAEFDRKKSDLRKDLRHCLKDDSLAAGIRQLLKQLGKTLKKKEKETVKEILSSAQVVLTTNTGAADPLIRRLGTFDLVVIDEAGQAIEPSCWIPILQGKRSILAGDQCQLAPVILSRKALEGGLGISLLERAASLHEGVLATRLTMQYRMNDAIASWASKEMYGGSLTSSSTVASHLLVDSPFVKPTWIAQCPLLLLDTRMPYGSLSVGCEEHLDPAGTGSFYNEGEADVVVQHVFSLIYAGVSPSAIAVQSPYVAQVQLLRERLDELPEATGIEVATIDSFQGREADAVIISMVRSNTLGAVGFLGDSRRMNVAITRARKHVAVVCDSSTICHNTFLARLLRHIRYFGRVKHVEPGSLGGYGLGMTPLLPSVS
ncbi:hypothetical protein RJ640_002287 [Escallonia rubra]|uniref:Helicase ATP-binding domain-containing protein n=1 Tax=Escallonia rubra TaxID=112253 RepID=A0AA88RYF1_9ASTE|nr:hypothetical protein RJ640_002287 [Escallonia rubra]